MTLIKLNVSRHISHTESISPFTYPFDTQKNVRRYQERYGTTSWSRFAKWSWDILSYYELLTINPIVFYYYLVIILQVPLVDKFLIINVYKLYNLSILLMFSNKKFCFVVSWKMNIWHSFTDYHTTLPPEHGKLTHGFMRGHMSWFDMALYPTEKVYWCLYTL